MALVISELDEGIPVAILDGRLPNTATINKIHNNFRRLGYKLEHDVAKCPAYSFIEFSECASSLVTLAQVGSPTGIEHHTILNRSNFETPSRIYSGIEGKAQLSKNSVVDDLFRGESDDYCVSIVVETAKNDLRNLRLYIDAWTLIVGLRPKSEDEYHDFPAHRTTCDNLISKVQAIYNDPLGRLLRDCQSSDRIYYNIARS